MEQDNNVPQIHKDTDYNKFILLSGNRAIKRPHVESLKKAMERKNLLAYRPIMVNKNYAILDGQHRFAAAKDLGLPIYYVISPDAGHNEVALLNANASNWSLGDYLKMYVAQEYPEYIRLNDFITQHDVALDIGFAMVLGKRTSGLFLRDFRDGKYTHLVDEAEITSLIKKWKDLVQLLREKTTGNKKYLTCKNFCVAFQRFATHPHVKWEDFWVKLEPFCQLFKSMNTTKGYEEIFVHIYDHKKKSKKIGSLD
jgi:hypothetical protein